MSAAYRGYAGRRIVRRERLRVASAAASQLQRIYRGRMGRRMFRLYRSNIREKCSIIAESIVRGKFGRINAKQRRDREAKAADVDLHLTEAHRRAEWTRSARVRGAPVMIDAEAAAARVATIDRHLAGPAHLMNRADGGLHLWSAVDGVLGAVVRAAEGLFDDGSAERDARLVREQRALLASVASLATSAHDYDGALELARLGRLWYPRNVCFGYWYAIALLLSWPSTTRHGVRRPEYVDEAAFVLEDCWRRDPHRLAMRDIEMDAFWCGRRRAADSPRALCACAVALHAIHGSLFLEPDLAGVAARTRTNVVWRARALFDRATEGTRRLEEKPGVGIRARGAVAVRAHIEACGAVFEGLFAVKRRLLGAKTKALRTPGLLEPARWAVRVDQCGSLLAVSAEERGGDVRRAAALYVLQPDEFNEIAERQRVDQVVTKHALRKKGRRNSQKEVAELLTDYVLKQLVLVSSHRFSNNSLRPPKEEDEQHHKQQQQQKQQKQQPPENTCLLLPPAPPPLRAVEVVIPGIRRRRALAAVQATRAACAILLQRRYLVFNGRAAFKRLVLQRRARERQAAMVAVARALGAQRRRRGYEAGLKLLVLFRAHQCAQRFDRDTAAATVVQRRARGALARREIARAARVRADGHRVVTMLDAHGMVVSGTRLLVTVRRCGLNFKFLGYDVEALATYHGACDAPTVGQILDAHHAGLLLSTTGPSSSSSSLAVAPEARVRHTQHDRVLEVVLRSLALVDVIEAPTVDLAKQDPGGKALVVETTHGDGARLVGRSVVPKALGRVLRDTRHTLRRYNDRARKLREKNYALGLPPPDPTTPENPLDQLHARLTFQRRMDRSTGVYVTKATQRTIADAARQAQAEMEREKKIDALIGDADDPFDRAAALAAD